MRKRIFGLWVDMRVMMSVFEGLCRPVFYVFCVMMMRSICMSISCSVSLRIVLWCRGLNVSLWFYIVCCSCGENVTFV